MKQSLRASLKSEIPFFMVVPALVWQVLFFYLPLFFVIYISFTQQENNLFSAHTWENYATFFAWPFARVLLRSFSLAVGTSIICLLAGYPIAYYLARRAERWKNVLLFLLVLPFWTNMLVQVYAWFALLERVGFVNRMLSYVGWISTPLTLLNNSFAIYVVMVYYYLPFMVIPIYAVLEKLQDEYLQASRDLGATPIQTFWRVTLPLSMSGITTGFFLVFIPAFGEFVIPGFMGGHKYMYVGSLISYYYLVARNESMGAAFTVVSGVLLLVGAYMLYRLFVHFTPAERAS